MRRRRSMVLGSSLLALGLLTAAAGCGSPPEPPPPPADRAPREIRLTPADNLPAAVAQLAAGDTLTLAAGEYKDVHLTLKNLHGRADAWITLRGEPGARVALRGTQKKRIITVDGCSYLQFENLELGPGGWDAFKFFGSSQDIVVDNCFLHDLGGGGINCSGIDKLLRLRVSHCHIMHTGGNGEGFYLGHQDGEDGKSVFDSIIEFNLVHDTGGDQGDGIELNAGGLGNTIRHNVVFNTNYPCIFVEGRQAGPPNRVIGNVCWNSNNEALQVNGNAIVTDNTVMGGRLSYALGRTVEQARNHVFSPQEMEPEPLLLLGLAMIRQNRVDTAAARAEGLDGEGFNPVLPPKRLAEVDGGTQSAVDVAERIAQATPLFKPEAHTAIRRRAIARIAALDPTAPETYGQLPVDGLLVTALIWAADVDTGLTIQPLTVHLTANGKMALSENAGPRKTVPWRQIDTNLLGRLLWAVATAGGKKISLDDRLLICDCYALGGWAYQLNSHLSAVEKVDSGRLKQFQADIEAQLTGPLPPSYDRPAKKPRPAAAPPSDLAPDATVQPVAPGFTVE